MLKIKTERLELIAEDLALARAAVEGREALAAQLSATVSADWPHPIMADANGYWVPQLEKNSDLVGWAAWHIVGAEDRTLIGCAGFKGLPSGGRVDIGYVILDAFQGNGYATEAAGALIDWAFTDLRVDRIVGETLPHLAASIRVMQRLGFKLVDKSTTGHDGEENVVQYAMSRP